MTASSDPADGAPPAPGRGPVSPAAAGREPWLAFAVATGLCAAFFWLARFNPLLHDNLHGVLALIFLYTPWAASRWSGVRFDYGAAGLRLLPAGPSARAFALVAGTTWPVFVAAFFIFYGVVCSAGVTSIAHAWSQIFAPLCPRWLGFSGTPIRLPADFLGLAFAQIVVIATPEELFFRGYLYARFEARWPSTRRFAGALVGWPLVVSSVLFALGHVLVDLDPRRFAVFFPGLVFGFLRARSGGLAAGILYHAGCNLLSDILHESYFR